MNFTPGAGATVQATSLENQCYSIARSIQSFERTAKHNPGEEINMITSSSDDDTQIFSGNCEVYAEHKVLGSFYSSIYYRDPYSSLIWDEGEDGQGTANHWVEALVERFLALATFERNETYNVSGTEPKITNIEWRMLDNFLTLPINHNCILSFEFSLDYKIINSSNGTITEAVPYLSGVYPGWS
ncbi:MAG: hypothetical protein F6K24_02410 [Okeania sp. SIO2D1]|nr:hypothetical protein [Okeania sp. SIO2D1]